MYASALIVFREVLEAALVLSIVAAATKMVSGRNQWLAIGVVGGLVGALAVALFAGQIAQAMEGLGQEFLNATVLFVAVAMLGWHNIWMQRHGRELAAEMSAVGAAVSSGARPLYAVAIAVGLAVLREGSEVVLFLYGIASGGAGAGDLVAGSALGLAAGGLVGLALYAGLLRLSTRYLFSATSWMIVLLAAGMAAGGAKFLSQAGVLPDLGARLWDTSWLLSEESALGQVFHVLVGYVSRPSGIQLVFYLATILIIGGLMIAFNPRKRRTPAVAAAAALALALTALASPVQEAKAGAFKVYYPYVEKGELEIEYRGDRTFDGDDAKDNKQKHLLGVGYGFTDWWFTELYGEWEREAGAGEETAFAAFEWENRFQVTNPGEYWADFGVLVEFERTDSPNSPDEIKLRLLFAKNFGKVNAVFNVIFERKVGGGARDDVPLLQAFQLKYRLSPEFEPGIELHSEFGPIDDIPGFDEQEHRLGPIVAGVLPLGEGGPKLKYNAGYLFGLTDKTSDGTFKAIVELEFPL